MSEERVCGIKLSGEKEEPCSVAFLEGEELEVFSTTDDQEILDRIEEERPIIISFTTPLQRTEDKDFREDEEDLVEEGHSFLPPSMFENQVIERTVFMRKSIKRIYEPIIIECRPMITSERTGVESDRDLKMLGIDPSGIKSAKEFEAVMAALTARMYSENDYEDKGFIVPKKPKS